MKEYQYEDGLESKRLITRFVKNEDWSIWAKFYEDKEMGDFLPTYGETESNPRAKKHVKTQLERYRNKVYGMQWLIDKRSGHEVGQCGLLFRDVNGMKEIELGYAIFKQYGRKGYAVEAVKLFQDYAFEKLNAGLVIALIDPRNVPSQNVVARSGMTKNELVDWKGYKLNVWTITREEWVI